MSERTQGPRFYETRRSVLQTTGAIQRLLAEYGARAVALEFSGGDPVALSFSIWSEECDTELAIRIVPHTEGVERLLESERRGKAKAAAVAWRQLQELLVLQLELARCGVTPVHELFAGGILFSDGASVERFADALAAHRGGKALMGEAAPLMVTGS